MYSVLNASWVSPLITTDDYPTKKVVCPVISGEYRCCKVPLLRYDIDDTCVSFVGLLNNLRNKKVTLFGDSITRQTFKAFQYQLVVSNISFHLQGLGSTKELIITEKYNVSVELFLVYQIYLPEKNYPKNGYKLAPVNQTTRSLFFVNASLILKKIKSSDIVIFNIGIHYGSNPSYTPAQYYSVTSFTHILRWIRNALEYDMMMQPLKSHFYRLTFPQHFKTVSPYKDALPSGDYSLASKPYTCIDTSDRHWSDLLAQVCFDDSPVKVLDLYEVFKNAGRYHSAENTADCSHFCWNHHLWRPFWGILSFALDKRELGN